MLLQLSSLQSRAQFGTVIGIVGRLQCLQNVLSSIWCVACIDVQEGEQGRVPLLIIRPKTSNKVTARRPTVVCLHSTGGSKETMRPFMEVGKLLLTTPQISVLHVVSWSIFIR